MTQKDERAPLGGSGAGGSPSVGAAPEVTSLEDRVRPVARQLLDIKRRWFLGSGFEGELRKVTRDKPFRIHNSAVWMIMLDMRDALVVHLASWARAQYEPGGLFGQLRAHHLRELRASRGRRSDDEAPSDNQSHQASYRRLFPTEPVGGPQPSDVDELRKRFVDMVAPLTEDRNSNRAHFYQKPSTQGRAAMMGFDALGKLFQDLEQMLNDLTMVSNALWIDFRRDISATPASEVASDIVDQVLLGPLSSIEFRRCGIERELFYEQQHKMHESNPTEGQLFNEVEIVNPVFPWR